MKNFKKKSKILKKAENFEKRLKNLITKLLPTLENVPLNEVEATVILGQQTEGIFKK